jgi:hypothetical protein
LIQTTTILHKKIQHSDELSKKVLVMLNAASQGEEVPIEVILKHNREAKKKAVNENDLKALTLREILQ